MVNIPLFTRVLYIPGWLFGISEASTVPFPSLPVIPPWCLIGMFLGSSHNTSKNKVFGGQPQIFCGCFVFVVFFRSCNKNGILSCICFMGMVFRKI